MCGSHVFQEMKGSKMVLRERVVPIVECGYEKLVMAPIKLSLFHMEEAIFCWF